MPSKQWPNSEAIQMRLLREFFGEFIPAIEMILSLFGWVIFFVLAMGLGQKSIWLFILFMGLGFLAIFWSWYFMRHILPGKSRMETDYDLARQAADRLSPDERANLRSYLDQGQ